MKISKIILSPNTFFSSVYSTIMNNLLPDFSDIEQQTYNLDLNKLEDKIKNFQPPFSGEEISTGGSPFLLLDINIFISCPVTFFAVSITSIIEYPLPFPRL